jgi:hypothetical protein
MWEVMGVDLAGRDALEVFWAQPGAPGDWIADLSAPPGQVLVPGTTYPAARRYPFDDASPGLSVVSPGHGCVFVDGTFTVDALEFDAGGLRTAVIRFGQHCEQAVPALRGTLEFHAA